jgi:hypothetical protein
MPLLATCHCGATKIELPHAPVRAGECNCTFCARTGAVWGYYQPGELGMLSNTADKFYSATSSGNEHHFCTTCGMQTYGVSPDWASLYNNDGTLKQGSTAGVPTQQIFAINLRLIDGFDWSSIEIEQMDGRNSW